MNSKPNSLSTLLHRRIGPTPLTLLAALALAFTMPARAGTQPAAIPFSDIGAKATANYQGDALGITATADGARLRCGFQKLEGHATPEGLWLESTKPDAAGRLRLMAVAVGRAEALAGSAQGACAGGTSENSPAFQRWDRCGRVPSHEATAELAPRFSRPFGTSSVTRPNPALKRWAIVKSPSGAELPRTGKVSVADNLVRFTRPGLTEEYSVSVDGVRQDFIIESPPLNPQRSALNQSAGDLRVELALSGAQAEVTASGARLRLEGSGRTLTYSRLRVEDATGRELTARLEVLSAGRLAVSVADADATYPVRIDPTFSDGDWVSLGSGMGGLGSPTTVYALAVMGTDLYAGGIFSTAGGVPATSIAKWNGSAWSALGSGINGEVSALAVSGTNLYAGGRFTTAGGVPATNIAKWDGSTWSALGSGMGGGVWGSHLAALAVSGGYLYAGGSFTTAGGVPANYIAKWDGSAWSALGAGMNGSEVTALAVSGTDLYAGGFFTTAGGATANYIAKWNGSAWSALGSGMDAGVYALAVSATDLYAAGVFSTAGGVTVNEVAKWNGSAWSALGSGMNATPLALAVSGTNLYIGGPFGTAGGVSANCIARWDGSAWSALGSGMSGGGTPTVNVLAADGAGHLFVGGSFTWAGTNAASYIAKGNVGGAPTNAPPVIVASPANLAVPFGATACFQVAVFGSPPLAYQWIFNGTNAIDGATSEVLSLANVQFDQAGAYSVTVSNLYGVVTSAPAVLTVTGAPPVIVDSPASLQVAVGAAADFQVVATGSPPLVYQWVFNGTTAIAGATSSVLSLTNVQFSQAGAFSATVSNLYGAVTSAPALLQVFPRSVVLTNSEAALRAAIAGGGVVTFACDGTIVLANTITNDTDTTLDASGHNVTISGNGAVRVFCVNTNVSFTAVNLTIAGGASRGGSAIVNLGGTVNLAGVTFGANTATITGISDQLTPQASGGAIYNRGGTVNATNCSFSGNTAQTSHGFEFPSPPPGSRCTAGPFVMRSDR